MDKNKMGFIFRRTLGVLIKQFEAAGFQGDKSRIDRHARLGRNPQMDRRTRTESTSIAAYVINSGNNSNELGERIDEPVELN